MQQAAADHLGPAYRIDRKQISVTAADTEEAGREYEATHCTRGKPAPTWRHGDQA